MFNAIFKHIRFPAVNIVNDISFFLYFSLLILEIVIFTKNGPLFLQLNLCKTATHKNTKNCFSRLISRLM